MFIKCQLPACVGELDVPWVSSSCVSVGFPHFSLVDNPTFQLGTSPSSNRKKLHEHDSVSLTSISTSISLTRYFVREVGE